MISGLQARMSYLGCFLARISYEMVVLGRIQGRTDRFLIVFQNIWVTLLKVWTL